MANAQRDFALRARSILIEGVAEKAASFDIIKSGTEGENEPGEMLKSAGQNEALKTLYEHIKEKGFDRVIEDVACTWFIRILCIMYMEVNGYLPAGTGVFGLPSGNAAANKAFSVDSAAENVQYTGKIQCKDKKIGLCCGHGLIKLCEDLAGVMPFMFEDTLGYEPLLLPEGQCLDLWGAAVGIDRECFRDNVQIIGWLYQYYISPSKDEAYRLLRKNKKMTEERIPAATQLFTPDWVVKYMVENTLGSLWIDDYPDCGLRSRWRYYIQEAEQRFGTEGGPQSRCTLIKEPPENIMFMDPAMGSGHILVYAFDMFYDIYSYLGYKDDIIPSLILEKNLYGLDIDDRAAAIACFVLMMKARNKDRDFFQKRIRPNLYSIQHSGGISIEDVKNIVRSGQGCKTPEGCIEDISRLLDTFADAKGLGSALIVPDMELGKLQRWWESLLGCKFHSENMSVLVHRLHRRILCIIKQARIMKYKYHAVVTNPPYMGIRGMNRQLREYLNVHYKHSKHDLFTVFMDIALEMAREGGYLALINQHSWMFLSSYTNFREIFFKRCCICNMLHLGEGVFGGNVGTIVQSTAFIARKVRIKGYRTVFIDLRYCGDVHGKGKALLDLGCGEAGAKSYTLCVSDLEGIPGKPIAYWADRKVINAFLNNKKLGEIAKPRQGMATSDNKRFIKYWYEVPFQNIGFGCGSIAEARSCDRKWFPYNKGGPYRKWYGNNLLVVNWADNGKEIKELASSLYGSYTRTIKNIRYYFKEAVTYTFISADLGARYSPPGFIFDVAGSSVFVPKEELYILLAYLCSKPSKMFLKLLNPTFNIQVGDIKNIPIAEIKDNALKAEIISLCKENIQISKADWDFKEISWDFKEHPIIHFKDGTDTLEGACLNWIKWSGRQATCLKHNEERLNEIFINLYDLKGSLTPVVEERDITIAVPNRIETVKSFISYAVGCVIGRYDIDEKRLVHHGDDRLFKDFDSSRARKDNIIPITDAECFTDNLSRLFTNFVEMVFGTDSLTQNMGFIAHCIGKRRNETDKETIDRYFERDFFKEHVLMYNRRPVYWLFDSGRENGFKALIYLHRFNPSSLLTMREEYLNKLIAFYRSEICKSGKAKHEMKGQITIKKGKQLEECILYDRALSKAIKRGVNMDFDAGIVDNYLKFQDIVLNDSNNKHIFRVNLLKKIRL